MFRRTKLNPLICRRLLSNRMSSTSTTESSSPVAATPNETAKEKSLIPEHLRYRQNQSSWQKLKRYLASDSGPMIFCWIGLIGVHVWVGWYLFGGEFEDDFEDERVYVISDVVTNTKKRFRKITSIFGSKVQDRTESELIETENLASS